MSLRPWSGTWCVHALECIHKSYTLTQSSAQSQSRNTAADWPLDEATPQQSQRQSNLKVALQECRPKNVIIDIMTVCWTLTEVLIWPLNENWKLHFFGVICHESHPNVLCKDFSACWCIFPVNWPMATATGHFSKRSHFIFSSVAAVKSSWTSGFH